MFSSLKGEMTLKSSQNKTNTLPLNSSNNNNNNNNINGDAKSSLKLTKSSTLPSQSSLSSHAGTARPEISRPILQTATPTAASLISKAASTGVPQNSILASNHKHDRPARDKPTRGVVFCDPLTMPSPTNPNTPPIIHQPHHATPPSHPTTASTTATTSATSTTSATAPFSRGATLTTMSSESPCSITSTFITPTWSVVSLPKPDAVICRFEDYSDSEDVPVSSPDSNHDSRLIHGFSMFRSKLKKKPAKDLSPTLEKGKFRSLEISGPILQSSLDSKLNLVPVCRAPDIEPYPDHHYANVEVKENHQIILTGSCGQTKENINGEVKSRNSCTSPTRTRRPASIATTRPSRPTSKPPQPPPPSKTGEQQLSPREPFYSTIKEMIDDPPPLLPPRPTSMALGVSCIGSSESSIGSPQDLSSQTSSPLFSRKSPEADSPISSEGDFLREIIKEMTSTEVIKDVTSSEDVVESCSCKGLSSLFRKKGKKKIV